MKRNLSKLPSAWLHRPQQLWGLAVNRIIPEPNATIKAQTNNGASSKCVFIFQLCPIEESGSI